MNAVDTKIRAKGKQAGLLLALRRQIVDGVLLPGQQLPTRRQLEQTFQVSSPTLQRAVDQLVRDGFVTPLHGRGTYVAANPPHLCNYALIFPHYPGTERLVSPTGIIAQPFVRFWTAMVDVAMDIQRAGAKKIPVYYGVDGHVDAEDYQSLLRDIEAHRLAGLIFATPPFLLTGTPILEEPGLPRVAVMETTTMPGIPAITLVAASFIERAVGYLASIGCKRIAFLGVPAHVESMPLWEAELAAHGMSTRPYWQQFVGPATPQLARNCAHGMVHENQRIRPDALVITDDNLVEYATAGVVDAGVKVPGEMQLVAHCNFPSPTVSVLPARRLGFDASRVVRACLESIDQQRRGETPPVSVFVPAQFEEELN